MKITVNEIDRILFEDITIQEMFYQIANIKWFKLTLIRLNIILPILAYSVIHLE